MSTAMMRQCLKRYTAIAKQKKDAMVRLYFHFTCDKIFYEF